MTMFGINSVAEGSRPPPRLSWLGGLLLVQLQLVFLIQFHFHMHKGALPGLRSLSYTEAEAVPAQEANVYPTDTPVDTHVDRPPPRVDSLRQLNDKKSPELTRLATEKMNQDSALNLRIGNLVHNIESKDKYISELEEKTASLANALETRADKLSKLKSAPMHIMYGLCGNHTGFLSEFEVSLKSVLLNAPHHRDTHIHILADREAYEALSSVLNETQVDGIPWWRNITITYYNVEPHIEDWKRQLRANTRDVLGAKYKHRHTFGAYFRLFSHQVLPSVVDYALYLDTDGIALANLAQVWQYAPKPKTNTTETILVTAGRCDGVMLINVRKLDTFWRHVSAIQWDRKSLWGDNAMVNVVRAMFPGSVATLSDAWDLTVARNFREFRDKTMLLKMRPGAGLVHYNGGGGGKEPAFEGPIVKQNPDGIGLAANFYRDLPWTWARFMGQAAADPSMDTKNTKIRIVKAQ